MIEAGADVMYAERFGVSDAAKERGVLAIGNVIDTQPDYPATVVTSALWHFEPTLEAAIAAVQRGAFEAADYGVYSFMKAGGCSMAPLGTFEDKVAGGRGGAGRRAAGRRSWTAASRSRSTTPSRSRAESRQRAALTMILEAGEPAALRLAGVTKRFGALVANDDVSFELRRGEVVALLGENGAGKTTLMNILFGHYVADAGDVEVFGRPCRPVSPAPRWPRASGMVHQHFTLADNMTVLENVALGTRPVAARLRANGGAGADRGDGRRGSGSLSIRTRGSGDLTVGRAAAGGDPQGALPRREDPDPRRADRRADAAGGRGAVRHAAPHGRRGAVGGVHLAQARRGAWRSSDRVVVLRHGRLVGAVETAATRPRRAGADDGRRRSRRAPRLASAARDRRSLSLEGVATPDRGAAPGLARRGPRAARRADHRPRRRVGQRTGGAGGADRGARRAGGGADDASAAPQSARRWSPRAALAAGVGRIPEDRNHTGVIAAMSLTENAVIETYRARAVQPVRLDGLARGGASSRARSSPTTTCAVRGRRRASGCCRAATCRS